MMASQFGSNLSTDQHPLRAVGGSFDTAMKNQKLRSSGSESDAFGPNNNKNNMKKKRRTKTKKKKKKKKKNKTEEEDEE